jgi:hypothetical protein
LETAEMSEFEILQIYNLFDDKADFYWNLFVSVNIALLGLLVYFDKPVKISFRIMFFIIYLSFSLVVYFSMIGNLNFITLLQQDVQLGINEGRFVGKTIAHIVEKDTLLDKWVVSVCQIFMALFVFAGVFWPSLTKSKNL